MIAADMSPCRPHQKAYVADCALHVVQYLELAFEVYERWYTYAAVLFFITLAACMASSIRMYMKRMQLYRNVHHQLGVSGRLDTIIAGTCCCLNCVFAKSAQHVEWSYSAWFLCNDQWLFLSVLTTSNVEDSMRC